MATKQKHRAKRGGPDLLQQAQRSLEKSDFKQALKDAKVAYRQQLGSETRQLLERAHLHRGRQLYRAGLRAESQAVIESLLELGATDASVRQELPELLIALGLVNRVAAVSGTNAPLEEGSPFYTATADHAVLGPDKAPASLPAIRQGAATIQRALRALEGGDEAEAMAALKDIARASPFADWKYFVRGLAAYYRNDSAEVQANWDRLDAGRFAAKIAGTLKGLVDPAALPTDDFRTADTLARLQHDVLGAPVLARLQTLQGHVAAGRWREAVRLLRTAKEMLGQLDAGLPQRLTKVLYAAIVRQGKPNALRELAAVTEPLPIDPHWNRGFAMAWEHCDEDEEDDDGLPQAERYWRAYLDDLAHSDCVLLAERTLARSLVWLRLGEMLADESCPMCPSCGVRHEPDEALQRRAIDCFENALKLSPELLDGYQALAGAYREWGEPEHAAATWQRLIERFPEDLETLLLLADHHLRRDDALAARDFVFRAQRLKPLDAKIKSMVWSVHLASARHHALAGRWDEGRAEFAAVEKVDGPHFDAPYLLVCRAAIEFKAGDLGLAHRLLDQATTELGEAAPIWLSMAIESRRYALSEVVTDEFEHRWLTSLKKSRRSAAAGEMCRMMAAYLTTNVNYFGRDNHVATLLDFLRKCKRVSLQAGDFRRVLDLLMIVDHRTGRDAGPSLQGLKDQATELLTAFAGKARRKFPAVAFFQFLVGEVEMRKGPRKCNYRLARRCFEQVLKLPEDPNDPDYARMAKRARENLDLLDANRELPFSRPSAFAPSFDEADDDDGPFDKPPSGYRFGNDEEDEEEDGLPAFSPADSPKAMIAKLVRVCRELGLDPEEFLKRAAAAGGPFRFRTKGAPSPKRRK